MKQRVAVLALLPLLLLRAWAHDSPGPDNEGGKLLVVQHGCQVSTGGRYLAALEGGSCGRGMSAGCHEAKLRACKLVATLALRAHIDVLQKQIFC
jgi:hypothetical protein